MNESYRLRYTNQIVGTFLLVFLVSVVALGIVVTRVSRIFVTPDLFYFNITEDKVSDLRIGTEVIVLGRRIGQVDALEYVDNGANVQVTLAIDPQFSSQLTNDSEVTLDRKFGLGTTIIKIRRRSDADPKVASKPLSPGSRIKDSSGEKDRVEDMAQEVEKVSKSIQKIETDLKPTLDSIRLAAEQLSLSLNESFDPAATSGQNAFNSVENTSETLRPDAERTLKVIRDTSEKLQQDISQLTQQIQSTVDNDIRTTLLSIKQSAEAAQAAAKLVAETSNNIDNKTDKTTIEISETLAAMRQAIESVQRLTTETRQMVQVLRSEVNELPGTTERFNNTVDDTQDMVGEIRNHWLLRNSRRPEGPSEQLPPSSVRIGASR